MKGWLLYSALALLAWGVWGVLPKVALDCLEPGTAFVFEALGAVITGFVFLLLFRPPLTGVPIMGVVPALFAGVLGFLGMIFFLLAVRCGGKICVIAPLTALYPVLSIALALIFFKEKINLVQCTGIVLAVIAVFLIAHQ